MFDWILALILFDGYLVMTLFHAYFDGTGQVGRDYLPCYAGIGGSQLHIAKFNAEWSELLKRHELVRGLTMKEALVADKPLSTKIPAQSIDERIDALMPFGKCIRRNLTHGFGVAVDGAAFQRLQPAAQKMLGKHADSLALGHAMLMAGGYLGPSDRLAVISDDDERIALECYAVYRALQRQVPTFRERVVALSFADDEVFFQLQGADMLAALFRRHSEMELYKRPYDYERLYRGIVDDVDSNEEIIGLDMMLLDENALNELARTTPVKYPAVDLPSGDVSA